MLRTFLLLLSSPTDDIIGLQVRKERVLAADVILLCFTCRRNAHTVRKGEREARGREGGGRDWMTRDQEVCNLNICIYCMYMREYFTMPTGRS